MIELAVEGARSSLFPCTLAVLVPGLLALVLGARHPPVAVATYLVAVTAAGGLRFAGTGLGRDETLTIWAAAILVGAGLVLAWIGPASPATTAGTALAFGVAAALRWAPCVGRDFGRLLGSLPRDAGGQLPGLSAYAAGLLLPLVVLAALGTVAPVAAAPSPPPDAAVVATAAGSLLVVAMLLGAYDDVLDALYRLSA